MTTTSSTTATTTSHHEDDGDPLETAILYQSTNPKGAGCGHAVPLGQWSQQQLPRTTCPVCGVPCTYIVDAAADTIRTNHKSNSDDTANPHDPPYPTVLFKYGKLVYRLTVPTTPLVPRQQQQHAVTPWWWIRGWFGGSSAAAESTKTLQRERTAQERIRTVLGIQRHGMKILYKGKILYPVSSFATTLAFSSTTPRVAEQQEEEHEWHVSQQLLELSMACRNNVPCLWVMGTPARDVWLQEEQQQLLLQRQHQHLDNEDDDKNTSCNPWTRPLHALRTVTVRDAWHWGQWLVGWSVRWTWRTVSQCAQWLQMQWPWWGGAAASSSSGSATATPSRHEHGD